MRWTHLRFNVIKFKGHEVNRRGDYTLHTHGTKSWILHRRGVEWYIYGPYNTSHVVRQYNSL